VWFTGHSLGAALATLAASRYQTAGVYTFGSPLVGNQSFAAAFNAVFHDGAGSRSFRYVNDHDVVTQVPPGPLAFPHGRFTHVDEPRGISRDGNVGTLPSAPPNFIQDVFGTPRFLIGQTVLVAAWIAINVAGFVHFDLYPFILLNLAFSLQAAYAAPLILLAQNRQEDRDRHQQRRFDQRDFRQYRDGRAV